MQYNKNTIYSVNNVLESIKDRRYSTNNSRYLSWEDCHTAFLDVYNEGFNCNSVDVLALHLSGYNHYLYKEEKSENNRGLKYYIKTGHILGYILKYGLFLSA